MDNKKLENLEIAIAHQDQMIQELSDVIADQWKHIEKLNRRLDKALGKIECLEDGASGVPVDRPPHH